MRLADLFKFFLFLWVVVDAVNGFVLKVLGWDVGVSQVYKILIVVFGAGLVVKYFPLCVVAIFLAAFIIWFGQILTGYFDLESIVWLGRAVCVWVVYLYFWHASRVAPERTLKYLLSFCIFSLTVAYLNVVLGVFGIGHSQYGDGVGGTGYIYAGNELTLLIVCCQIFVLSFLFFKGSYSLFWVVLIFFLVLSILKATKTAILFLLLAMGIFAVLSIKSRRGVLGLFILMPVILLGGWAAIFMFFEFGLFNRIMYFYNQLDFWTFVFSGRNNLAEAVLGYAIKDYALSDWMFGKGVIYLKSIAGGQVEIDPIDILVGFGFVGLLFFYSFLVYRLFLVLYNMLTGFSSVSFMELFFLLILVFISCFAGHVVNSGIAAVFISIVFVGFDLIRRVKR